MKSRRTCHGMRAQLLTMSHKSLAPRRYSVDLRMRRTAVAAPADHAHADSPVIKNRTAQTQRQRVLLRGSCSSILCPRRSMLNTRIILNSTIRLVSAAPSHRLRQMSSTTTSSDAKPEWLVIIHDFADSESKRPALGPYVCLWVYHARRSRI